MQHTQDTLDIALLRSDRHAFILKCQPIIEIVVKNFIRTGLFEPQAFRDIMQAVNEDLIFRLPGIERNYNGSTLMTTYMNAVIRNICLDIHKREQLSVQTVPLSDDENESDGDTTFHALMIQEEVQRFGVILTLYHHQRPKLILCMKLFHRLPLTEQDLTECFGALSRRDIETLLSRFGGPYEDMLENDTFTFIAPFMNRTENNQTSGASLRRWTQEQITRIKTVLNNTQDRRTHTKETIRALLDQYTQQ